MAKRSTLAQQAPRPATQVRTAAQVFLQTLADAGVSQAWGIPGGTISPVFDALCDEQAIAYVATRHELAAAFAALGHARVSGRPALVLTTSGPGVTNVITAVASAHFEQLPMIVVGGEVPARASGRGALQDGTAEGWRAAEVLGPIVRWAGRLCSPGAAQAVAARALGSACGAVPGPVFVSVPLDLAGQPATSFALGPSRPLARATPAREACLDLARALARAKRPLLVLGNGARSACKETLELAEAVGMRVIVTGHAKGCFPESHPHYLGISGLGQHPSVDRFLLTPPDVTLVVGSRLNDLSTNGWSVLFEGTSATFHLDRDPVLLGRNVQATHCLVGDAARTLRKVLSVLVRSAQPLVVGGDPLRRHRPELERSDQVPLAPPRVLRALQDVLPDAIWCSDIGEHLAFALHYVDVDSPDRFHNFLGFGSMGSGVGAALGIQRSRPGERVICLCGDGGFSMLLGELLTAVEQRLPLVFVVMNDARWNMVEHGFQAVYGRSPDGLAHARGDFAVVARALGAAGVCIERPEQLERACLSETLRSRSGPIVLDVRIDPSESLTRETRSAAIRHFRGEAPDV
ncbi:MAG: thiamine pyrophosphate-binding protein [Myxococcales bacterium]|nr:thiamine pyrophosphate-binding protein [Myxococcales bacterium]